jgi:hypothetical protein
MVEVFHAVLDFDDVGSPKEPKRYDQNFPNQLAVCRSAADRQAQPCFRGGWGGSPLLGHAATMGA